MSTQDNQPVVTKETQPKESELEPAKETQSENETLADKVKRKEDAEEDALQLLRKVHMCIPIQKTPETCAQIMALISEGLFFVDEKVNSLNIPAPTDKTNEIANSLLDFGELVDPEGRSPWKNKLVTLAVELRAPKIVLTERPVEFDDADADADSVSVSDSQEDNPKKRKKNESQKKPKKKVKKDDDSEDESKQEEWEEKPRMEIKNGFAKIYVNGIIRHQIKYITVNNDQRNNGLIQAELLKPKKKRKIRACTKCKLSFFGEDAKHLHQNCEQRLKNVPSFFGKLECYRCNKKAFFYPYSEKGHKSGKNYHCYCKECFFKWAEKGKSHCPEKSRCPDCNSKVAYVCYETKIKEV